MKKRSFFRVKMVFCITLFLLIQGSIEASEPYEYRYTAPLVGNGYGKPVKIALTHLILERASQNLEDIRIFDNKEREIPYAIYIQHEPVAQYEIWDVIEDKTISDLQTIIIHRPQRGTIISDITIKTNSAGMYKDIEIYSSQDNISWQQIGKGILADFTPKIDIRSNIVECAETSAQFIKLIMKDTGMKGSQDIDSQVFYKKISGFINIQNTGGITVNSFSSKIKPKSQEIEQIDQVVYNPPPTYFDKEGNTIINLGKASVPIEYVSFNIKERYFYREVELMVAERDEEDSYKKVGHGVIYRISDYMQPKVTLFFGQNKSTWAKLKLINNNKPALLINEVSLSWVRRNLYFIPEEGKKYALYCGGKETTQPGYDLQKSIKDQPEILLNYASWDIGPLENNPMYKPGKLMKKKFEQFFLIGFVILLIYIVGFWFVQLKNSVPRRPKI